MQREENKWMPVFDMRDLMLLHTPILWIMTHLTISLIISIVTLLTFCVGVTLLYYYGIFM